MPVRPTFDDQESIDERRNEEERSAPRRVVRRPSLAVDMVEEVHGAPLPIRRLAAALLLDSVTILKSERPKTRRAIAAWEDRRELEAEFLSNERACGHWCEAAGIEWDAMVSRLRAERFLPAFATAA